MKSRKIKMNSEENLLEIRKYNKGTNSSNKILRI